MLDFYGGTTDRAILDSDTTTSFLNGMVNVSNFARIEGNVVLGSGAQVQTPLAADILELAETSTIQSGVVFTGSGGVHNLTTGHLTIEAMAGVGVSSTRLHGRSTAPALCCRAIPLTCPEPLPRCGGNGSTRPSGRASA